MALSGFSIANVKALTKRPIAQRGRPTWSAGAPELTGDDEIPREGSVYWARLTLGEVAESAEGSRLLSGYRVKSSVPGSNPGLSAKSPPRPETARAPSHLGARVRVNPVGSATSSSRA